MFRRLALQLCGVGVLCFSTPSLATLETIVGLEREPGVISKQYTNHKGIFNVRFINPSSKEITVRTYFRKYENRHHLPDDEWRSSSKHEVDGTFTIPADTERTVAFQLKNPGKYYFCQTSNDAVSICRTIKYEKSSD